MVCCAVVSSSNPERQRLAALLAAVSDPAAAAGLAETDTALVAVARHHRLTPLLCVAQGNALPPTLAAAFRRDRLLTAARSMLLGQVAEECVRNLAAAGIDTILLKGLDYEVRLYGAPGTRPTADVDLLVPNEARREAFAILDRLGFQPRAASPGFDDADYHEVAWTRGGVEVDLHMGLAPFARCRIDYAAVWREAEPFQIGAAATRVLARRHAAIFHGLHMAIDHFAVPAIYLLDLARLLPAAADRSGAAQLADEWRCGRPLRTSMALAAALLPAWAADDATPSPLAKRVITMYGGTEPLPRPEQLLRKFLHFDAAGDAFRYLVVQSRRNVHELLEVHVRRRSPRSRLGL